MRIAVAGATGTVGHHVVTTAASLGHEVVPLSRRSGQDVLTGDGIRPALRGVDVAIDVSGITTTRARTSVAFFRAATETLLAAERDAGVDHHIALSVVGIDDVDAGYYAGKLAQERLVSASPRSWSILRAGQFHEFAEQVAALGRLGPLTVTPAILTRPIAAREVADALVDIAVNGPVGRAPDLTGPSDDRVADMVRRMFHHDGIRRPVLEVSPPGRYWRGTRSGVLRGSPEARHGTLTFDDWLDSPDHTPARPR